MTMSYLDLLFVFLVGPILVLGMAVAVRAARHAEARQTLQMVAPVLGGLVLVATFLTAPWDAWMIDRGVFVYPPAKVAGWVGRVPAEDFLLFALHSVLAGLWAVLVGDLPPRRVSRPVRQPTLVRAVPAAALVAAAAAGIAALSGHALYLAGIAAWFAPLLAIQYGGGRDVLLPHWRRWLAAVVPRGCGWPRPWRSSRASGGSTPAVQCPGGSPASRRKMSSSSWSAPSSWCRPSCSLPTLSLAS
jgi:lycopene cyclase domain-containing protein